MSKKNNIDINKLAAGTATQWKEIASRHAENRRSIERAQEFAIDLMDYMDEHKISQKELADRMDVSPQQVNKILRAKANLTFNTLDKIEAALGITISSPQIMMQPESSMKSDMVFSTMKVVYSSNAILNEDFKSLTRSVEAPVLNLTPEKMEEYSMAQN